MRRSPFLLLAALACVQPGQGTPDPAARPAADVPPHFYRTFAGTIGDRAVAIVVRRELALLSGWYADEGRAWLFGGIEEDLSFQLEEESGATLVGRIVAEDGEPWRIEGERRPPEGPPQPMALVEERTPLPGGGWIVSRDVFEADSAGGWSFYAQVPAAVGDPDAAVAPLFDRIAARIDEHRAEFAEDHAAPPDSSVLPLLEQGIGSSYESSHQVALAEAGVIAIEFGVSTYYLGAAHPNHNAWTVVWDAEAGAPIELADVFRGDVDGIAWVSERAIARLEATLVDTTDPEWIRDGAGPDPANFAAWVPAPEGIRIAFDPYVVAAYAAGPQEVVIGWSELAPVLDPDGPLAPVAAARGARVP